MPNDDILSYQHEPLICPPNWSPDSRRLIIQMNNQLDILYARLGRLEKRVKELEDDANV